MFDAQSWLQSVSDSVRAIKMDSVFADTRRELIYGKSFGAVDETVHSSVDPDKMKPVDALVDMTERQYSRLESHYRTVREAVSVFEGMRYVGLNEHRAADVLEAVHIGLLSQREAATRLRISKSSCNRHYQFGVGWLNANGLAHAKNGRGRAV